MIRKIISMLLIILMSIPYTACNKHIDSETSGFDSKVVSIADGDTLTVLAFNNKRIRIRLSGIDTPEKSQDFGTEAKQALFFKIFDKTVRIKSHGKDRYGRTLGDIYLGDRWINLEMVSEGYAWHYKKYSKDQYLAQAELNARKVRKGLWADSNSIPPWEYRRGVKFKYSKISGKSQEKATITYWLNTSSGTRHNSNCQYYENTKKGRLCLKKEGKACGICGG